MTTFTFRRGGIHPPEKKSLSVHKQITGIPLPETVAINLNQHLGKPAKPIIKMKEEVTVGQQIGEADGFISAHVHSSVSGTVKKIQQEMTAVGSMAETILIDVDKKKTQDDYANKYQTRTCKLEDLSVEAILEKIKKLGIVGEGGATFPTHVKLSPPPGKKIDTVIINGAECEPFLTADHQLMTEKLEEIIEGVQIIQKVLNVQNTYIGIENNKPDVIKKVNKHLEINQIPGVKLARLKTKYPQGGEKQLIKAILNREVPSGKLPFDVGVLVHNVGTIYSIFEAVYYDKPLIDRITTISGFVNQPGNFRIPVGVSFSHAIDAGAGGFCDESGVQEVINGGPMMGKAVRQLDVSIMKGTSGILALSDTYFEYKEEGPCIRCGRCISSCPMGLMPTQLALHAKFENAEELKNALDCIECGTCSYICPTNRQLVHWIRVGKAVYQKANRS